MPLAADMCHSKLVVLRPPVEGEQHGLRLDLASVLREHAKPLERPDREVEICQRGETADAPPQRRRRVATTARGTQTSTSISRQDVRTMSQVDVQQVQSFFYAVCLTIAEST